MVFDGGGHFNPAGIDGVHTCLYYYRPIQHMTVPRVIHTHTNLIHLYTERGYSTSLDREV